MMQSIVNGLTSPKLNYVISILPSLLEGLKMTVLVFIISLIGSLILGLVLALGSSSRSNFLRRLIEIYIWIIRGTPLMLQIVFIFFGLAMLGLSLERLPAVLIAFSLNYAAYFGEILRGGIKSIDQGQREAARVLGMSRLEIFRRVILPQTIKISLPSMANEVVNLIKDTSLIYVVGLGELLRAGKIASNRDVSLLPLVLVGMIYLFITGILSYIFRTMERSYSYYK